jgi:type IV secretory pathway TraG/TraD family ATPase VirD4
MTHRPSTPASLQRLPQLHTAMTEARKSNSPLVLGFQGRSQLAKRYGLDAEAMRSQPATKIFLRTTEPDAAKWISQTAGRCGDGAATAESVRRRWLGHDGSLLDELRAGAPG